MKTAAAFLHQALHLLNECSNPGQPVSQEAQVLMKKAKVALLQSATFQSLLVSMVPDRWQNTAQQRVCKRLGECSNPDDLAAWCQLKLEKIVVSLRHDEALVEIIQQIQSLPPQNSDRRNLITQMLFNIQDSDRVRTYIPNLPPDLYADALHETLLWFCDHIDEYDPTKSGPITWFNLNLLYAAHRLNRLRHRSLPKTLQGDERTAQEAGAADAYEQLNRTDSEEMLEALYRWVREDRTGQLKKTMMSDRPELNAQVILKALLDHIYRIRSLSKAPAQLYEMFSDADSPPSQPTDLAQLLIQLAERWHYPYTKLRRFWRERCQPHLGDFLQQSGYQ